ncbi:MAG TPA: tripartite tricarboxylate transporter substrate binding protein [Ramlibacter sp.]|nr:tripartite tricarboxylate transporter substrate binding protein [Ramlibacter sp.]
MKRTLMKATLLAITIGLSSAGAAAGDVVKLILSAAPGGPQDRVSRLVLPALSAALGKTVIVDYRGGAGGTLASNAVAKSPPDGETLLVTTFSYVLTAGSMSNLPYDPRKDLEPIYLLGEAQTMLVARPSLGVANLKELAAKARDGKLNYGSNGVAGTMHLGAELFARTAGVQMTNIPYRGAAPALTDLLAGMVDVANADVPLLQPYVKDGRLKGLAIFDSRRSPLLPDVPTSVEQGMAQLQMTSWIGVMAPKGTPPAVRQKLVQSFSEALRQPELVKQLAELGYANPRADLAFKAKLDKDFEFWIPWLKNAGIRAE